MATVQFKLPIGAKRQVTIPRDCMDLLALEEGGEVLLEVVGDHAILLPMVSVPRRDLPEELRQRFEARRGKKPTDLPLGEFLGELAPGADLPAKSGEKAKPSRLPRRRSAVV